MQQKHILGSKQRFSSEQ